MKKLIVLILAILTITGNLAQAQSGPEVPPQTKPTTTTLATEKINDIDVPYTILLDAQMVFQGFAVTEARQYRRNGQEVYALRMDNSDSSRGPSSFYLLFTTNWQYIDREEAPPPPPPTPAPEEPKTDEQHEDKPQPEEREHDEAEEEEEQSEETVEEPRVKPQPRHNRD